MIRREWMALIEQKEIAKDIFSLTLQGDLVRDMSPGQFVHVKIGPEPLLRRPISICSIDRDSSRFTMLYRAGGTVSGTRQLASFVPGMKIDVLGPLGNGFPVEAAKEGDTVLAIGGGIGVPPLYELSKQLVQRGVNVRHVLGFQSEEAVFYEKEFSLLGPTYIATADGTYGTKGFVTDIIATLDTPDLFYTCGPTPMLRAVEQMLPVPGFISMEQRMGCGIGACLACVCHVPDNETDYKKVCTDGPVFTKGEVVV